MAGPAASPAPVRHPVLRLNDGHDLPQLGLGLYKVGDAAMEGLVHAALQAGYRGFDTASFYGNERALGDALRAAPLARAEVVVTTKLWNDSHDKPAEALAASLERLRLETVDLYLIHWPQPTLGRYVAAWRALAELRESGLARSIGVSNFTAGHLRRLMDETGIVPAVNQVELHPRFQQRDLRAFHAAHGIVTQSWSPLGRGRVLDHRAITAIAERLGRTPAQVVLRWHVQSGLAAVPKSSDPARAGANAAVFDFALDAADLDAIAALDDPASRTGPHPDNFG